MPDPSFRYDPPPPGGVASRRPRFVMCIDDVPAAFTNDSLPLAAQKALAPLLAASPLLKRAAEQVLDAEGDRDAVDFGLLRTVIAAAETAASGEC